MKLNQWKLWLTGLTCLGLCACNSDSSTTVAATPPAPPAPFAERIQTDLNNFQQEYQLPGISVAIIDAVDEVFTASSGTSHANHPITADTLFAAGSITKTLIATRVLQLVEAGTLALDTQIDHYLPDIENVSNGHVSGTITLRQLLQHSSGLGESQDHILNALISGQSMADVLAMRWSTTERLAAIAPADALPDQEWRYRNANYIVIGAILEQVGAAPISTQLQNHLWTPLGMRHSYLGGEQARPAQLTLAHPWMDIDQYGLSGDGSTAPEDLGEYSIDAYASQLWSAAAVISSASDCAHFLKTLFETDLLADWLLAEMTTPYAADSADSYGLGLRLGSFTIQQENYPFVGHGGQVPGYSALVIYLPEQQVSLAIMANVDGLNTQTVEAGSLPALAVTLLREFSLTNH